MAHELTRRSIRLEQYGIDWSLDEADVISENGKHYIPIKIAGRFVAFPIWHDGSQHGHKYHIAGDHTPHGLLLRPVHPSMTYDDIEGAVFAHDTGTHWVLAHCSPAEQLDFAAQARTFAAAQFAIPMAKARVKVDEATTDVLRTRRAEKFAALASFAEAVGEAAYDAVTAAALGHFHGQPHHDHLRDLTVDAIDGALAAWKKDALTDTAVLAARAHITGAAAAVRAALTATRTIEWRHARSARLEAEKKAAEAAEAPADPPGD